MANTVQKESKVVYLQIGQNYEHLAENKQFDVSEWVEAYPDATIYILFRRPGEDVVAPVQTTLEDGILTWTISNWETGIIGVGFAEIRAIDSATGLVKKSHVIPCSVEASVTDEDTAPDFPSWVDRMITMNEHLESVYTDFNQELTDGMAAIQDEAAEKKDDAVAAIQAKGDTVIASIPMSYTDLIEALAGAAYNANRHYDHDEFVWYDNALWRRRTDSPSIVGPWNEDDWTRAALTAHVTEALWQVESMQREIYNSIAPAWDYYDATASYAVGDYVINRERLYRCISPVSGGGEFDYSKWEVVTVAAELQKYVQSGAIAPVYSASATYKAGQYVWYSGNVYRCKVDIDTAEAWTAAHWQLVKIGDELTSLKSAVAQKINEPITEGSDGQALVTDGNGGRSWATVISPTDSSLSIAGRAADAKATGDEITSLKSAVAEKASAIVSSVTRYYHNSLTSNDTTIVGNSFSRDEVKLNLGKSYVQAMRDNYAPSGLTISARDGRFSVISGTISANLASLYIQAAADGYIDTNAIKGKKVRVVTRSNIAVAAGGYGGYVPQISIRNNSTHLKRQNCNTSDIFNNEFTVDIPADAEKLNVIFLYLESGLNLTGVEIFLGVYLESDTVISTGKTVSDGETLAVTLPQGTTEFDSMDHASNQTAVIDTKTYVDNIVPDDVLLEADLKYLSPEMFGAVGDGVTNDAAAVQACINAAIQRSLPVRGYGNYRCGAGINIVSDYGDYYLHKIEISAGAYVVKMTGTFNRLRIDNVRSYGITGAAGFVLETDATHNCESNDIWLGACTANGHAIQFTNIYGDSGKFIYYNRLYVLRLLSQTGDAIHMESNGYGCMNQNSFWAKHAHCNNGYAVYSVGGSIANRVYEICCEHYTKNVAYGSCAIINPLVADCMNEKTVGGDRGRLFVVENEYPSISMTGTLADWLSVDVSGAWSFEDARDYVVERLNAGDSHGQAFYKAFSTMKMGQPVVCSVERLWNEDGVSNFKSRHCPPGKVFVYFNHKGYIPDVPWRNEITTNTYTPVVTDGRIPTIFEIGANTSIYLDDSYCCIGIKDVTIVQKDGNKAVVYGKDYDAANPSASIIFDGTNQADGTYVLHCTMTPFSMTVIGGGITHEYTADAFEGLYVGTNDAWTVEKLNMIT